MKARAKLIQKIVFRGLPFVLIAAVAVCLLCYPRPKAIARGSEIAEVWNVDTFEGGKGSRTSFLDRVARRLEAENPTVRYLVASYTAEGARAALRGGMRPDVISFGLGLPEVKEYALPLPYSFPGAETEKGTLALPWCAGKYFLFSFDENFGEEGSAVLSRGGSNLPALSACLAGIEGEELSSGEAYTSFLSGKYRYLLGTQRDVKRFLSRGTEVFSRELPAYNDLYQCVSLLSDTPSAVRFLEELLSECTQNELESIGMYPFRREEGTRTPDLFSSPEERAELEEYARSQSGTNFPDKLLKYI